jgi:hypothetical protein
MALAAAQPASAADAPNHVVLTYEITMAGLAAGSERIEADLSAGAYEVHASTRTRGLIDTLVHFRSEALSRGTIKAGAPRPLAHNATNRWRGKDRRVSLNYSVSAIEADVAPDAQKDDRDPVPPAAWVATTDPITAAFRLMLGASGPAPCTARIAVFDGRRRYDLVATDAGLKAPNHAAPGVEDRVCRVAYVSLAGRSRNPWWPRRREPKEAELWFRAVDSRLPPVAVVARASAGPVPIAIRLTLLSIDGATIFPAVGGEKATDAAGN